MLNKDDGDEEIIDYRKIFAEKKNENQEETEDFSSQELPGEDKSFSIGDLNVFWKTADRKTKAEVLLFLVSVLLSLCIFYFYFVKSKPNISPSPLIPTPSNEKEMFGH